MSSLIIGGVPEHFNLPWRLIESEAAAAPQFEWRDYPGGTGALVAALRDGSVDVAVLLTEGAVAAHAARPDFAIVSTYTDSPLIWGIHVPGPSPRSREAEIRGARYAISRRGSGSHLMAFAHARHAGWPVAELRFVEVGSLDGARSAFAAGSADVFFWEKFMTKPLVDSGEFRRVGEFCADWPAFVVCARRELDATPDSALSSLIDAVLARAQVLAAAEATPRLIAERFGLSPADAREWLALTRWSMRAGVDERMLARVADVLADAGVIERGD